MSHPIIPSQFRQPDSPDDGDAVAVVEGELGKAPAQEQRQEVVLSPAGHRGFTRVCRSVVQFHMYWGVKFLTGWGLAQNLLFAKSAY